MTICLSVVRLVMSTIIIITTTTNCTGLDRSAFDNKSVSFEEHCNLEHNMWHYLYFIILVKVKDPTEFTGPESYVCSMIQVVLYICMYSKYTL